MLYVYWAGGPVQAEEVARSATAQAVASPQDRVVVYGHRQRGAHRGLCKWFRRHRIAVDGKRRWAVLPAGPRIRVVEWRASRQALIDHVDRIEDTEVRCMFDRGDA